MRKHLLLTVWALCSTGCATVLTGSRAQVSLESDPPGATVVILRGLAADLALKSREVVQVKNEALKVVGPFLPADVKEIAEKASPDELLTQIIAWTKLSEIPPEWVEKAGSTLQKLPEPVAEQVSALLGVEALGVTPYRVDLGKGEPRAILTWKKGSRAKVLAIEARFNWVVVANVLNLGLGVPIDIISGAWFNLDPTEQRYTLEPLGEIATPPPVTAPLGR